MYKTSIALILGNGFDKDLGLPSSFPEFARSVEWENLFNSFWGTRFSNWFMSNSLLWHLKKAIMPNWFEIEEEIHNFILEHPKITKKQEHKIQQEFEGLKLALSEYLNRISREFKANKEKLAYQLLCHLPKCPVHIVEISFNYTNPDLFIDTNDKIDFVNIFHCTRTHVHGSLNEADIVLGCDIQDKEVVNRPLSFMYKYNMLKRANFVALTLLEAKEIIFFGHSVNEMDFCYFREFFKMVSASPKPFRNLTFITWDEKSERDIKDNIRNQGVSVTDLYNNLFSLTFIHSSKIYNGDYDENEKWKDLLFRLQHQTHQETEQ